MPREKMSLNDRAKIFSPFDALKGFREMLKDTEKIKEPRKELSEDYLEELNKIFNSLEIGTMIAVKYYDAINECYITKTGVLSKINLYHKRITICKDFVYLKDIIDIKVFESVF